MAQSNIGDERGLNLAGGVLVNHGFKTESAETNGCRLAD
jgi:hypothetical protein